MGSESSSPACQKIPTELGNLRWFGLEGGTGNNPKPLSSVGLALGTALLMLRTQCIFLPNLCFSSGWALCWVLFLPRLQ